MLRYALDRIITAVPVLLLVALGTFLLVFLMPGDPATTIAGDGASREQIEIIRQDLGLDQPIHLQFWAWLQGLAIGDFGTSYSYSASVSFLIAQRFEVTLSLVVVGFVIAIVVGTVLGVVSGLRIGGPIDRVITVFTTVGMAAPTYWIAILFIIVFSLMLGWVDATGYTRFSEGFIPWLQSIILPSTAIAVTSIADVSRQVRSTVSSVREQDFVRTMAAMGVSYPRIVVRHIGRNSGVATVTIAGLQVERLIGAAVVVELLFAMPGFGSLLLNAVLTQDLPVIQTAVLLVATVVIATNLIVDLSYGLINPRIRVA